MDISYIPFAFPGVPGVRCAFQTAQVGAGAGPFAHGNISLEKGGDPDDAKENREALQDALGFATWTEARQHHSADMLFDPAPTGVDTVPETEADGLATTVPGQALVIKTADCQPILLTNTAGTHIAALHAGWRGNRIAFPATGVDAFCQHYHLDPAEVLAVRGPSLGPKASEFKNFALEWSEEFRPYLTPADMTMNLWQLTRDQLLSAGLKPENIFSLDLCTYSLAGFFFSYRRANICGRQASLIWIDE